MARTLANEGLSLTGQARPEETRKYDEPGDEHTRRPRGHEAAIKPNGDALINSTLVHRFGFTTDRAALRQLPLRDASAILVLADADDESRQMDTQITDAEVLASAMLLRSMIEHDASMRRNVQRKFSSVVDAAVQREQPPVTMIVEFTDALTRRLLTQRLDGGTVRRMRTARRCRPPSTCCTFTETTSRPPHSPLDALACLVVCDAPFLLGAHGTVGLITCRASQVLEQHELHSSDSDNDPAAAASFSSAAATATAAATVVAASRTKASAMRAAVGAATSLSSKRAVRRAQTSDVALFSFYDLSGRCSSKGLGVLIGWRRQPRRADAPSLSRLPSGDAFDRAHSRKGNGANHFSLGRAAFTALSAGARAAGDAHEAVVPNAQAHLTARRPTRRAGWGRRSTRRTRRCA